MSIVKKNSLIFHPRWEETLKFEWLYEKNGKPENYKKSSAKRVWWKCQFRHEWKTRIEDRTQKKLNCPYCSNKKVLKGYNDLKTTHPEICKEWDYEENDFMPENFSFGSSKKIWWICNLGHKWKSKIGHRSNNSKCPYCLSRKILIGFNDLLTKNPELCKFWNYKKNDFSPETFFEWSNKKVWWICNLGHEWLATINSRSSGSGCPYCSNKKVLKGYNDLKTTHPEICEYWDYVKNSITPLEVTYGSGKKVWWICRNGHRYKSSISLKIILKRGCPKCLHKSQTITGEILKENFENIIFEHEFMIRKPITNENGEKIQNSIRIDYVSKNLEKQIFVEYNGEQHYKEHKIFHKNPKKGFEKQQQRDQWLRKYCEKNDIILIEIDGRKYKTREEIEPYLLNHMYKHLLT